MYEMTKRNQVIILIFAGLLLFGIWYNSEFKKDSTSVDAVTRTVERVAVDLESKGAFLESEPLSNVDIFTLLPVVEPVLSDCADPVTKNGNSEKDEAPIKTLPPDVPLIEERKDDTASTPDASNFMETEKTTEAVETTEDALDEWVPFVYFYRQSMTPWGPMRTMSVHPMPSANTAPACPTTVCPVYPVVPVYPVFPAAVPVYSPKVVPARFGAPKLVYPNGVVIKPKVYYPNQKVRNVLRAVTP